MNRSGAFIVLALLVVSCTGGSFLVETESFDNKGGWLSDHQAFGKIHSSYLLAHGKGTPVEDATTTLSVRSPGRYHVYASTYNWTAPWYEGEGPGAFRIAVDGKVLPETLGTKGDSWGWQYAGCVDLDEKATLSLKDLTGFDGRVDALYFTKKQRAPSGDYLSLDGKRRKWTGVAGTRNEPKADLVVVGGGIAGCSTALTAARYGLNVILIDNLPWLGGNAQLFTGIGGVGFKNLYPKLGRLTCEMVGLDPSQKDVALKMHGSDPTGTGGLHNDDVAFSDELRQPVTDERSSDILDTERKLRAAGEEITDSRELKALREEYIRKNSAIRRERILKEAGVRVYQNIQVYKVRKKGSRISSVTGKDLGTGEEYSFSGTLFADCTGDGAVGYIAGADFAIGREGKDFANEPSAPEVPDKKTQGLTLWWYSFPRADAGTFPKPDEIPWAIQVDSAYHINGTAGDWWWETGLEIDNALEAELVRDNLLRAIYGNWAYLKNYDPDYAPYRLDYVQHIGMKRESRRLLGDVILTESDIMSKKEYEDASFTSTWTIDVHTARPDNAARYPGWEWVTTFSKDRVDRYHVPYRCLYSRNIDNLFIGGRCMSVSHLALGTVRVQFTLGMAGEVTGMAAKICKDHGSLPRSVYTDYLDELKDCMTTGIPGTK
ncbi:MAG: FAD-dependent oxidoreductase [Bacteroidales bacterium]|nr:FAD-dependent oxidoreductase [Bacteroidales bacterium]